MTEASPPSRRRVALVDDHEVVRIALASALDARDDLVLDGSFSTVDALIAAARPVDLVVLDLRLGDGSSPTANVDRLTRAGHRVLGFTAGDDPYLLRQALRSDLLGVVRKSEPIGVLVAALQRAARGEVVVTAEWANAVETDPQLSEARLSAQEARILALFADGAKSQVVASRLGITVGTLEDYVRRIRVKYARVGRPAFTKVDLYKRALEDGLLPLPSRE